MGRETQPVEVCPRATKVDRRRFELAKRAYAEVRYSAAYDIDNDDLQAIRSAATMLRDTVGAVSTEWLDGLRQKASPDRGTRARPAASLRRRNVLRSSP